MAGAEGPIKKKKNISCKFKKPSVTVSGVLEYFGINSSSESKPEPFGSFILGEAL